MKEVTLLDYEKVKNARKTLDYIRFIDIRHAWLKKIREEEEKESKKHIMRVFRFDNKEKRIEYQKRYYLKNKEKRIEYQNQYNLKNKEMNK
jgi:hypothetical protein